MTRSLAWLCGASLLALSSAPSLAADAGGYGTEPTLPAVDTSHDAVKRSKAIGWGGQEKPTTAEGFKVEVFADGLDYPRWMHVLGNGDVLVSEARTKPDDGEVGTSADRSSGPSANRISLLRDTDKDGIADEKFVLLGGLDRPFGILARDNHLYVAETDAVKRYPFKPGDTRIAVEGETIMKLPAGGYNNHWTRNIVAAPSGDKLYVTVGSASNVGEHGLDEEKNRAAIHEINLDGSGERVFASGLRNPNGVDFEPETGVLWTAVNERDRIGDDLVPDYITSVRDGGFYGWPFSYWGKNPDPRMKGEGSDKVATALTPDYALGAHTASMSILFSRGQAMPDAYRKGAFVAQHGSWNRTEFSGYKVLFVPFENGKPSGAPKDVLTGFVADAKEGTVHGRPTGLAFLGDGSLLVTDDAADRIWRISVR